MKIAHYEDRQDLITARPDIRAWYEAHYLQMSFQKLYSKGEIAGELAVRDAELEVLRAEVQAYREAVGPR